MTVNELAEAVDLLRMQGKGDCPVWLDAQGVLHGDLLSPYFDPEERALILEARP